MTDYSKKLRTPDDWPLRRDFRLLTWQFRQIVKNQHGPEPWREMEQLRVLAEKRQRGDIAAENEMTRIVQAYSVDKQTILARIIGMIFDLANLAEDLHRVRVLKEREIRGHISETIPQAVAHLRETMTQAELNSLLANLNVEPVFTAHPTEAKRRTVRRALRGIREDLSNLTRPGLDPEDRAHSLSHMRATMTVLWTTDTVSARKPTVIEELQRTIYMSRTLWRVAPRVVAQIREELLSQEEQDALRSPLQFGNWIGGDRDGNPYVTTDVTLQTLTRLRESIIDLHQEACRVLALWLTVAADQCALPAWLKAEIDSACMRWPELAQVLEPEHPHEWIVQWIRIIERRLEHSRQLPFHNHHPMAYSRSAELLEDVCRIRDALKEAGLDDLIEGPLSRWIDRIHIFGLHLLRLDIRVNATAVRNATAYLLQHSGAKEQFDECDEHSKQALLQRVQPSAAAAADLGQCEPISRDVIDVLTLIQRVARAGDCDAFGQVIVSMTHYPSDILAVIWLMQVSAFRAGYERPAAIPVTPLFETIDDLRHSDDLLNALLNNEDFASHLKSCNNQLTCMIGYSDSAKDGGYMGANWELYNAQRRLASCAKNHGTTLTIFHGRGGAIGRGGGPTARAILSLPREAVEARIRLTEQGEVIAERYDDPKIATRHLEQLFWATLVQSAPDQSGSFSEAETFAEKLAGYSVAAYRELVQMPVFIDYLQSCTALSLIESLPIGSRPSRRSKTTSLEDLRAIPFTFAWNQVRMPINAFYGLGAAFQGLGPDSLSIGAELYKTWPWFKAVINNAELALARCDPGIARRYLDHAPDPIAARELWDKLNNEYELSCKAVLAIKKEGELIEGVPWLSRTVRIRTPYLDILNVIQSNLLTARNQHMHDSPNEELHEAMRLTVQSIAAGLRNTG